LNITHAARITAAVALAFGPPVMLTADTVHAASGHRATAQYAVWARRALPPAVAPAVAAPAVTAVPTASATAHQDAAHEEGGPGSPPKELIVADLAAVVPGGATAAQVSAVARLPGVRGLLAAAGGRVTIDGRTLSILGVSPGFRSWAPPVTAAATGVWAALDDADMVADPAATRLGLKLGAIYQVQGTVAAAVPVAATAPLGVSGIDAIVNDQVVLVNAPGADSVVLARQIRTILGTSASVITLVPVGQRATLPVVAAAGGRPATWLALYQDSAADYCPGLSWTVLAAIGEIESGDGTNDGPSTAGALGPMQFMPGTWASWATTGFGQAGPPDIMNPLDAVPSAARLLCADGAAGSPGGLSAAIYDYNHATWYVSEVLDLAAEYAREYP
jgi:hypothetical protein